MRTNEELALMVQQGDGAAAALLWEQVHKLTFKLMSRYFPLCQYYNIDPADLDQESFFAVLSAARDYDPDKGHQFTSYLSLHVKSTARAVLGLRGHATRPQHTRSLDEPLPGVEDEEITLADAIPDPEAEAMLERVQEDLQRDQLRACLEECMASMPPNQADALRARYYDGKTLKAIAEDSGYGGDAARRAVDAALSHMRKPGNAQRLLTFLYPEDCHGYGFTAYRNRGNVSKVEVLAGVY